MISTDSARDPSTTRIVSTRNIESSTRLACSRKRLAQVSHFTDVLENLCNNVADMTAHYCSNKILVYNLVFIYKITRKNISDGELFELNQLKKINGNNLVTKMYKMHVLQSM